MLLTLIIVFLFFIALYSGAKRGLVLQLVLTIGYLAAFWLALEYHEVLREYLELIVPYPSASLDNNFVFYSQELGLKLDQAFYNGVSFLVILFGGWLVTRFVGGLLSFLTEIPVLKQLNAIGGAILSFVVSYVWIFLVLFLMSTVPMDIIQNMIADSSLAQWMITETPALSEEVYNWWIGSIA